MSSNPLCVRKSNTLYKEISFGIINDEILIIIIIILLYIISIGNNCVTSCLNTKLLKKIKILILLLCLGLSERKGLDNNSFNTHLSEPEPDPVLLPEEELSLLLSFSESDPDSLPDSDSNVFCNLIRQI